MRCTGKRALAPWIARVGTGVAGKTNSLMARFDFEGGEVLPVIVPRYRKAESLSCRACVRKARRRGVARLDRLLPRIRAQHHGGRRAAVRFPRRGSDRPLSC